MIVRVSRWFSDCLDARADALFELADAMICADGPVTSLAVLSLAPVFHHGARRPSGAWQQEGRRVGRDVPAGQRDFSCLLLLLLLRCADYFRPRTA